MNKRARKSLVVAGIGTGAAVALGGAGMAAKHFLVNTVRRRPDPYEGDDFTLPSDTRHHFVTAYDGGVIHALERGDPKARPLVLLHGITLQAGIWYYQLHDLADRFRVVAVDIRGHGQSRAGSEGFGLDRAAHDLASVLKELDLREAVVVGHSMGGMVVMRFCGEHPDVLDERVAGLVFLATTPGLVLPAALQRGMQLAASGVSRWGESHGWRLPAYRFPESDLSFALIRRSLGDQPSPTHIELLRRMLADVPAECFFPSGLDLLSHDAREALAATSTPSLVVVGTKDRITWPWLSRRIAAALPESRLVELEGCGHQPMLERRREVAELLTEFADTAAHR